MSRPIKSYNTITRNVKFVVRDIITEPCFGNTNYVRLVKKAFRFEAIKFGIQTPSIIIQKGDWMV